MNAPVLPIILPLLSGLLLLFSWKPSALRRAFAGGCTLLQAAVGAWLLAQTLAGHTLVLGVGEWSARSGILLAIDPLNALMVTLAAGTVLLAVIYGWAESPCATEHPLRLPLLQFLLMGINLSFCTGDLFNLFVGFEVMLISSYALLTLEADDWEIKQAYPYLALNLVGSTLFICAAGLIYALAGTLNYALLHDRFAELAGDPRLLVIGCLLVAVFALKAGLFPLYFWLPNSYPTLATPLAAVYAGLLTKVGIYVLLRLLCTILPHDLHLLHALLAALALPTLLAGAFGSLARGFIRGILAFQVIAAVGSMTAALGWFSVASVTACIFYLLQDVVVKSGLFLASGAAERLSQGDELKGMGGLWKDTPGLGVVFLLLALSLAGVPPLSGFWGKLAIVQAGMAESAYGAVAIILLTSVLTLTAMLRIWHFAFWRPRPAGSSPRCDDLRRRQMTSIAALAAAAALLLGLFAESGFRLAARAADRAMDADAYRQAVFSYLGKEGRP